MAPIASLQAVSFTGSSFSRVANDNAIPRLFDDHRTCDRFSMGLAWKGLPVTFPTSFKSLIGLAVFLSPDVAQAAVEVSRAAASPSGIVGFLTALGALSGIGFGILAGAGMVMAGEDRESFLRRLSESPDGATEADIHRLFSFLKNGEEIGSPADFQEIFAIFHKISFETENVQNQSILHRLNDELAGRACVRMLETVGEALRISETKGVDFSLLLTFLVSDIKEVHADSEIKDRARSIAEAFLAEHIEATEALSKIANLWSQEELLAQIDEALGKHQTLKVFELVRIVVFSLNTESPEKKSHMLLKLGMHAHPEVRLCYYQSYGLPPKELRVFWEKFEKPLTLRDLKSKDPNVRACARKMLAFMAEGGVEEAKNRVS